MTTTTEETVIMQKTRELCDTIVAQPEFQALQRQVAQFMNDEEAKSQYQAVVERGDLLQQKQQMGAPLEDNEIAEFNKHRDVLVNNPVARGFWTRSKRCTTCRKRSGSTWPRLSSWAVRPRKMICQAAAAIMAAVAAATEIQRFSLASSADHSTRTTR
jgi:cell fate (sporulation/competence/biofilm development) regulator YlbF (YheA/YmcA/DUF963 family)